MDPNPLPRKRRDPGPGWWAAVTPDGEGIAQPSEGSRAAPMACVVGPASWVGGGIPGQPLPGLPAGTSGLSPVIKRAPSPGYCSLPLCEIGAVFLRRRRRRLRP